VNNGEGDPWIRLHLRGERMMNAPAALTFKYRLTGTDSLKIGVGNRRLKDEIHVAVSGLKKGEWSETTIAIPKHVKELAADEILFRLPKGAELHLDDVLLYEPGR
jgi:hypothetical protein